MKKVHFYYRKRICQVLPFYFFVYFNIQENEKKGGEIIVRRDSGVGTSNATTLYYPFGTSADKDMVTLRNQQEFAYDNSTTTLI